MEVSNPNHVKETLSRYSDVNDATSESELLSAKVNNVVSLKNDSLSEKTYDDDENNCREKETVNIDCITGIKRSAICSNSTDKNVNLEQGEQLYSRPPPLYVTSRMDEMEIETEYSPHEILFRVQNDVCFTQSRFVDEMILVSDDVTKSIKREESSSPVPTTLDIKHLLKGSILDLILCPIDVTNINKEPCCHQCRVCPKIFQCTTALARHESTHTDRLPFTSRLRDRKLAVVTETSSDEESDWEVSLLCTHCDKKFDTPKRLVRHIRKKHGSTDIYNSIIQLNVHETRPAKARLASVKKTSLVNQSTKPQTVVSLIKHSNVHSQGTVGKCCICQETFESELVLSSHYKSTHRSKENGTISCTLCDYKTKDIRDFTNHGRLHTGEKPYMCVTCEQRFVSRNSLSHHVRYAHKGDKSYSTKCPQCGERFKQIEAYKLHRQTHREERPRHKCEKCHKRFLWPKSLRLHMRNVHDMTFEHICSHCGEIYLNRASLNFHMNRQHRADLSLICNDGDKKNLSSRRLLPTNTKHVGVIECLASDEQNTSVIQCIQPQTSVQLIEHKNGFSSDIGENKNGFSSDIGEYKNGYSSDYSSDIGEHKNGFSSEIGERQNGYSSEIGEHQNSFTSDIGEHKNGFSSEIGEHKNGYSSEIGEYQNGFSSEIGEKCCICQKTFESELVLHAHYKAEHTDKEDGVISCISCNYKTRRIRDFANHGRTHTGEKPYICITCEQRFVSHNSLTAHIKSVHQDDTISKKCPQCEEWIKSGEAFKVHRQTHADERLYVCEQCDKRFVSSKSLSGHIKWVHDKTLTHICTQCGKICRDKSMLKLHMISYHGGTCEFDCKICSKKYASIALLNKHTASHSVYKPYACSQCDTSFSHLKARTRHVTTVHSDEHPFVCVECGKKYKHRNHLTTHLASHATDRPFLCTVCGKKYPSNALLRIHARCHTVVSKRMRGTDRKTKKKNYVCALCNKSFTDSCSRTRHIEAEHKEESVFYVKLSTSIIQSIEAQTSVSLIEDQNDFSLELGGKCCICLELFESEFALRTHYKSTHRNKENGFISCMKCNYKTKESRDFTNHGRSHTGEKPYICVTCEQRYVSRNSLSHHFKYAHQSDKSDKSEETYSRTCPICAECFKHREEYKLHLKTHTDERPYVCEQCDKRFISSKSFSNHIRCVHDKTLSHICTECDKTYRDMSMLKRHMIKYHGGVGDWLCTVCGMKLPSIALLNKHTASHSVDYTEKLYACSQCDKSFSHVKARTRHVTTVHSDEHPFVCVECGKKYKHRNHLNTHLASHATDRPFLCTVCGKIYPSNTLLRIHTVCHTRRKRLRQTGERNYGCAQCDKRFYNSSTRTLHIKSVHNGERPHVCVKCGKQFKQKTHLNTHMTCHRVELVCT